jgi:hypothetical protein
MLSSSKTIPHEGNKALKPGLTETSVNTTQRGSLDIAKKVRRWKHLH